MEWITGDKGVESVNGDVGPDVVIDVGVTSVNGDVGPAVVLDASDVGAIGSQDISNLAGMVSYTADPSWVRTAPAGLLPYQSGGASNLGSLSWPFLTTYAVDLHATSMVYEAGVRVYSPNNKPTAVDLGFIENNSENVLNKLYTTTGSLIESTSNDSDPALSIGQNTGGTDAFITFHVSGDFAANFGLDGSTNKLSYGGWSAGAASYAIYHEGNKPTLPEIGYTADVNPTANTLVQRDAAGYLQGSYINMTASFTTGGAATGIVNFIGTNGADTYARSYSVTAVRDAIYSDRTNWSTVTDDAVVGQLGWKNYGDNHTIFDASASLSPAGTAVSNKDSQAPWTSTYPTLMGWNGGGTYGVRVDNARQADTALTCTGDDYYTARQDSFSLVGRTEKRIVVQRWGSANATITIGNPAFTGQEITIHNVLETSGILTITGNTMYIPDDTASTTHTFTGKGTVKLIAFISTDWMIASIT